MKSKQEQFHDDHVDQIYKSPRVIGLHNIVMSAKEVKLLQSDGNLYHQPDNLCFDPSTRRLYNVEYKSTDGQLRAYGQLKEQEQWLKDLFPSYKVINLYVNKEFNVKRL